MQHPVTPTLPPFTSGRAASQSRKAPVSRIARSGLMELIRLPNTARRAASSPNTALMSIGS
jgi:hypothetical protein